MPLLFREGGQQEQFRQNRIFGEIGHCGCVDKDCSQCLSDVCGFECHETDFIALHGIHAVSDRGSLHVFLIQCLHTPTVDRESVRVR